MKTRIAVLFAILALEVVLLSGCATVAPAGPAVVGVVRLEQGSVTLYDAPCTTKAGVFAQMPTEARATAKAATLVWAGKEYVACYAVLDANSYYVIDETGDAGAVERPKGT